MSGALAIDVADLTKKFGSRTVVDKFSIQVPKGQVWGFLGPNGSGKTTTIRMLCGLLLPDSGTGTCLGYDIKRDAAAIKRNVGYMTQKFSFYEDLSIRENLDFVARVYEMDDRVAVVDQAIDRLGLKARQQQLAGTLSGGWKQRLALAACILHRPQLLLLDEPTAGVDPQARRDFWDEIHQLAAQGLTVLVSTHYMDEAERCDRIVYLAYGTVLARGTVAEVLASSNLVTWIVTGEDVRTLASALHGVGGIDQVSVFGVTLHVSGTDAAALEQAIAPFRTRPGFTWERANPSLEDVFIHLMAPFRERTTG
ncbi:MAG: ABC transporter ATP-binding protein [Alphaproteobacteria bacterium]|nr:ABC transporter ATP-binding protein [Alphaproteobacteria bacterium]